MTMIMSPFSHYINVFFFDKHGVCKSKVHYYDEPEALKMFQRVINKYKGKKEALVCMRTMKHELIKSEKI